MVTPPAARHNPEDAAQLQAFVASALMRLGTADQDV